MVVQIEYPVYPLSCAVLPITTAWEEVALSLREVRVFQLRSESIHWNLAIQIVVEQN